MTDQLVNVTSVDDEQGTYLEDKISLLSVLMGYLADAERVVDDLDALEMVNGGEPDHNTLAISDLISDAYEAAASLRESVQNASKQRR